jgi:hypothetical protein
MRLPLFADATTTNSAQFFGRREPIAELAAYMHGE